VNYIQVASSFNPYTSPVFWLIVTILAVAAIFRLVKVFTDTNNGPVHLFSLVMVAFIGLIVFLGFEQFGFSQKLEARDDQVNRAQAQIEERYDLKLSDEQMKNLAYPESKPKDDFEIFGSFVDTTPNESGDGFVQRKLVLAWQNGKMILGQSTDGESFKQLASNS